MIPIFRDGFEINELKTVLENLDFESNFSSIIRIVDNIPANSQFSVVHGLKKVPSYRIILRQTDGGHVYDGAEWNDREIFLYNNGSAIRRLIVLILR